MTNSQSLLPPAWADTLLRAVLGRSDGETVSGDLLEQYRDTVLPARGREQADVWFVGQVIGLVWRTTWIWAVLFAALVVGREVLDWFVPPSDFLLRSQITGYAAISLFIALGCQRAWRTRSIGSSALAALIAAAIAAMLTVVATLILFAIWHDPETTRNIVQSGGLDEALTLPWMIIVPATIVAIAGSLIGKFIAAIFRREESLP
jgi:hypothetical protein